jgi:DNA-binding FadR family transcriptional regulator
MERVGLVAQVEQQLERVIALGRLPRCGTFGSEEKLARSYGVSRTTVREALRRLAARGLVVQHPGRKTRARALDESLTLENLGLALHHEHSPEGRRLLEGYFSLKRQVTVDLLAGCAMHATEAALKLLGDACFALWDVACLELNERCVQMEFELLKLAARATERTGHLLLLQSLQRAFEGIAARVLPLMDCAALGQWAVCAMHALGERDVETLKHKLSQLLRACDKRVLDRLTPVPREEEHLLDCPKPAAPTMDARGLDRSKTAVEVDDAPEAHPSMEKGDLGRLTHVSEGSLPGTVFGNLSNCRTGFCASPPEGGPQPEPPSAGLGGPPHMAALEEDEPLHETRGHPLLPSVPEEFAPRVPPLPIIQDNLPRERQQPFATSARMKASTPSPEG